MENTNTPVQSSIYNMKLSEKCQLLVRKGEFGDKNYMTLLRLKDGDYTFISFPLEVSAFIMEEIEHIKICIQSGLPRYFPMFGYSFMRHRKFNTEVIDFRGTFYLCLSQEHSKTYSKYINLTLQEVEALLEKKEDIVNNLQTGDST